MSGPCVVLTSGCWDLLHRGHVNALWNAHLLGDVLIVGTLTDEGMHAYKHVWPAEPCQSRMAAVRGLGFVDVVVEQETTDPTPLLKRFLPDVYCHADGDGDWSLLKSRVAACGVPYVALPYTPGVTSTALRTQQQEG